MLKSMSFPLTVPNRTSNGGLDFALQSPEFYRSIQFEIRKIGLLLLPTMCHKEQQTSDNLIVKDQGPRRVFESGAAKKCFEPRSGEKYFLGPSRRVWGHAPPENFEN